jgi:hypothetical protein
VTTEFYHKKHRHWLLGIGHSGGRKEYVPVPVPSLTGMALEDLALPFFFLGQCYEHGLGGVDERCKRPREKVGHGCNADKQPNDRSMNCLIS